MRDVKINVPLVARIPDCPRDWELYDKPGVFDAASHLADVMIEALQAETYAAACKIARLGLEKYSSWGAADTEGRSVAAACLRSRWPESSGWDI